MCVREGETERERGSSVMSGGKGIPRSLKSLQIDDLNLSPEKV